MGVSRPRWVGGHATEAEAKAARDKTRQRARRGEYVDRSSITVEEYLSSWLVAHSLEVKPKTFAGYRFLVDRYVVPRVGRMKLQSVRPMHISSLYRELLDGGGRNGRPLSRRTIDAVHRVLRKAFNDAVVSDQVLESNPVVRAKRPKGSAGEVGLIWTPAELGRFLDHAKSHRRSPTSCSGPVLGSRSNQTPRPTLMPKLIASYNRARQNHFVRSPPPRLCCVDRVTLSSRVKPRSIPVRRASTSRAGASSSVEDVI